jgi:hypothetical protein
MSFSDLTFYCRLSVLSACHSSKCEVLRHPFRSFDPLSPSFVPHCRSATLSLQTYQPQKFLPPCNSFCILLQSSRYPRTRTSLFRETWLALPVPNKRFNVDLGLTTSPTEVSRFTAARLFAARYSRSSTTRLLLWRELDAFFR